MPRGHLGRGPSIGAIGKSYNVDQEEPPEGADSDLYQGVYKSPIIDLDDPTNQYFYEHAHASRSAECLARLFKVIQPGSHTCKHHPHSNANFLHCKNGVNLSVKYRHLQELLETRAKLQLVRDYTSRISASMLFVKDLESVTMEEYRTWHGICHNTLTKTPVSKLEALSSICEDLRVHMSHWNSIKQLIHTDPWLQPIRPTLLLEMDPIRRKIYHLRDNAIWWIDRLIRVGLQVLAHSDLERLNQDALWSVTRGIEDFNTVVSAIRFENAQESLSLSPCISPNSNINCYLLSPVDAVDMNSYKNIGESIKPIPFIRVLHILANERSKYVAMTTHRILTAGDPFLNIVNSMKPIEYTWTDHNTQDRSKLNGANVNTSDYHSASGSNTSVSTASLKVGNIVPPDLSKQAYPIMEFFEKEQDFASKFLHIVCTSTNLLKKPGKSLREDSKDSNPAGRKRSSAKSESVAMAARTENRRKTVSWGDTADNSVKNQLTQRYVDLLWQYYGTHLFEFFYDPIFGGVELVKGQLGQVALCEDIFVIVIVRMIQQLCFKDVIPAGAAHSLLAIAQRVEVSTALGAWQHGVSNALASQMTDKCQPTPLADGEYSTKTARLFRDAFQPLLTTIRIMDGYTAQEQNNGRGPNGVIHSGKSPQLVLVLPTLQRLTMTCDTVSLWCHTKAHHFLSSWTLGSFLLVTQSDLKILGDEIKKAIFACQRICSSSTTSNNQVEAQMFMQMTQLWNLLNNINSNLQTLAGSVVKAFSEKCSRQAQEFFDEAMPVGKVWKKKANQGHRQSVENTDPQSMGSGNVLITADLPSEPNTYVEQAMDALIEPVVAGVSKLKTTAQLSMISISVVAMCEAWTAHILKHKIRFSIHGAYQLQQDFVYVRTWLESCIHNEEVRQSVLALDIFKNLLGAAELLKRQPRGRSQSRPPPNKRAYEKQDDNSTCLDCGSSTGSSSNMDGTEVTVNDLENGGKVSSSGKGGKNNADGSMDHQNYKVPHMEQWLALRVHGGARNWPKLPSCFTTGE